MPRTSKNREELTEEELADIRQNKCPDCGHKDFFAGPCGGGSQNFKCSSEVCGSRFNDLGIGIVERISDAKPDAPKPMDTGNTPYRGTQPSRFDREDPV